MKELCRLAGLIFLLILPKIGYGAEDPRLVHWRLQEEELYVFRFDMDSLNWRQIREERERRHTIQEEPKHVELHWGMLTAPFAGSAVKVASVFPYGTVFVRDPDGKCRQATVSGNRKKVVLPENMGANGRYLVGGHFLVEQQKAGGARQNIHLYPKAIVGHYTSGGRPGSFPAFFFNDPGMVLEIGSARSPALYRMGGGFQRPFETYDMEVRYRGRPLSGMTVTVFAEGSGWQRSYQTDGSGRFSVTPFDDRSGERHYEKLLYVVKVEDKEQHALHVATLPMFIFRNRPEWTSHIWGFSIWGGLGLVGTLLVLGGNMLRHRRQQRHVLIRFDQCRVKED